MGLGVLVCPAHVAEELKYRAAAASAAAAGRLKRRAGRARRELARVLADGDPVLRRQARAAERPTPVPLLPAGVLRVAVDAVRGRRARVVPPALDALGEVRVIVLAE